MSILLVITQWVKLVVSTINEVEGQYVAVAVSASYVLSDLFKSLQIVKHLVILVCANSFIVVSTAT